MVQIPRVKGHISVSDTFIFLSILMFGGEAGVLLSTCDAVAASCRLTKTRTTLAANVAIFSISTTVTVWTLRLVFGHTPSLLRHEFTGEYIAAICLMGLVQYIVNSGLVAIAVALRSRTPIWRMWKDNFLWTSITSFAGASAAGIIARGIDLVGIYGFLVAMPIVAVVYFTYTTYLKNVESAAVQADLAHKHVNELSHHIAEQERIALALKESELYFRNAFDHAAGMAVVAPDGKWLQVNESLCKMLGYDEAELLKAGFQSITHPSDLGNDLVNLSNLLENKIPTYQLEKRYCHKRGNTVWVLQSASLIRDLEGSPRHVIFQIQDISDRKVAEELIHHAAFHDALTGLPNRTLFADRLSMAIERAKRTDTYRFAVIFLDLDRFKVVNDSLGHDSGDKLLVELSRRLEECIRSVDSVARLGGDEFAILLDGISSITESTEVADRIQASLEHPFDFSGQKFITTA
ncbi:MAG: diguanylate cyclase, partial [Pyrinomonadaceae bacterium]